MFLFGYMGSLILRHRLSLVVARGAALHGGARASHCDGISCCRAQAPGHPGSVVAAPRPWSTGSEAVTHGLSGPTACGVFPNQGLNPRLLLWQTDSLPLSHQGSPQCTFQ